LIAALALTAAIAVAAWALSRALFEDGPEPAARAAAPAPPADELPRPVVAPDAAPATRPVVVTAASGAVERAAPGGDWRPLAAGDVLAPDELLRTGTDGTLGIDVAGAAQVELDPRTQISVPALTATVREIHLGRGRVSARVPGGGPGPFGVVVDGSGAVASTADGEFSVLAGGRGRVAVATRRGAVQFAAGGAAVEVPAGTQSVAPARAPPGSPRPIPSSLYLKVQRPSRGVVRERAVAVSGTTLPGALIRVDGVEVEVADDGAFRAVAPLREGRNEVTVETEDALGRRAREVIPVEVDSQRPRVGGEVTWEPPP
jgi:hypothetical protein